MKKITNFIIDSSNLSAAGLSKTFTVSGEKDAEFTLQVFNTPTGVSDLADFYDFTSLSFTAGFVSTNNLNVKMTGDSYNGQFNFQGIPTLLLIQYSYLLHRIKILN